MKLFDYLDLYRKGVVPSSGKIEKFELYPFEETFFNHIHNNRFSLIKKSRQMHITTMLASYSAWLLSEEPYIGPEDIEESKPTVIYFSPNFKSSKRFKTLTTSLLPSNTNLTINNVKHSRLENGNSIMVKSVTINSLRSYSLEDTKLLIIDEAAFIDKFDEFFKELLPMISTSNTKIVIASTPNGIEGFHSLWEGANKGENQFKLLSLNYKDNPRQTQDWLDNMKKTLNDDLYIRQELYGEFVEIPPKKKKKKKSNLVQVRLDDTTLNKIGIKLIQNDINISEYIRQLIKKDLSK
jgi:predicted DNA binding CopG/RHH family protein